MAKSPQRAIVSKKQGGNYGGKWYMSDAQLNRAKEHGTMSTVFPILTGNKSSASDGGRWVTMHGTHVFIADGEAKHPSAAGHPHNIVQPEGFNKGERIRYNDGRPGHDVGGTIMSADTKSMQVQFDDRAAPTTIFYAEGKWMNHLSLDTRLPLFKHEFVPTQRGSKLVTRHMTEAERRRWMR